MEPDVDGENIEAILDATQQRWNVDSDRLLMTGMSDGGTFTFMSGLGASSPFTHLAPIAASYPVMMMEVIGQANIKDRPIYLTHGLQDWMFDVAIARVARDVLTEAGAEVVYREIPDLAHTYPRDEREDFGLVLGVNVGPGQIHRFKCSDCADRYILKGYIMPVIECGCGHYKRTLAKDRPRMSLHCACNCRQVLKWAAKWGGKTLVDLPQPM